VSVTSLSTTKALNASVFLLSQLKADLFTILDKFVEQAALLDNLLVIVFLCRVYLTQCLDSVTRAGTLF
jgi:hypothetical protein